MLQIGFTEVGIVVVILLLILGPKRLPKALAFLKRNIRKLRGVRSQIQDTVEDVLNGEEESQNQSAQKKSSEEKKSPHSTEK